MSDKRKIMISLLSVGASLGAAIGATFLINPSEGRLNSTYIDPVGIATVCFGHTGSDVVPGKTYTTDECIKKLNKDTAKAEAVVRKCIKVPMKFYQEAALISFEYNVGEGAFCKSTLVKKFNAGDYTGGCNELSRWVYAGGKKLPGLVTRRERERQVCLGNLSEIGGLDE